MLSFRRGSALLAVSALCACASFGSAEPAGSSDAGAGPAGGPRDGLVLALDFEDGVATSAADTSGRGNDGTVFGGARVAGVRGNGLELAEVAGGDNPSVLVPSSSSLDIGGTEITIAFWISIALPLPTQDEVVLGKVWTTSAMESPYYQYGIELNVGSKTLGLFVGAGTSSPKPISVTPAFGTWTHVAFVLGGGTGTGYVNGVASAPQPVPDPITRRGNALLIGVDAVGAQPFIGKLDEVRIYDRALTSAEIGQLAAR